MTLTIKYTDDETMHYMEVFAGDKKLGEVFVNIDGWVTWENYMDHRKEYNLMTIENNGIIDDRIIEI
jgi:hypothetical protein